MLSTLRSASSREPTTTTTHETHVRKSATLPHSRIKSQSSTEKEDEPKLTTAQIRARFEAKRSDQQKASSTGPRYVRPTSTSSARARLQHKDPPHKNEHSRAQPAAQRDEKPAANEQTDGDADTPVSASSIRSKFEAASKSSAPPKRRVSENFCFQNLSSAPKIDRCLRE